MPPRPNIPPRQPGESAYQFRQRKSIAETGETLYQRRQRLGRARGLTSREAAGHPNVAGLTEYQRRRQRTIREYGISPWQLWRMNAIAEMTQKGFTPDNTGWSWYALLRVWPKIKQMNEWSAPQAQIEPDMLAQAKEWEGQGILDSEWSEDHINLKYQAMYDYHVYGDKDFGHWYWYNDRIEAMSANWWYYH